MDYATSRYEEDQAVQSRNRPPSRDQIALIDDKSILRNIIDRADEVEISVTTQLQFSDLEPASRHRKIDALSYWRIAKANAEKRLKELSA